MRICILPVVRAGFFLLALLSLFSHVVYSQSGEPQSDRRFRATLTSYNGTCTIGDSVAIAVGRFGALARSTDGGRNWEALASPIANHLLDVATTGTREVHALGQRGALLRSENAGESWAIQPIPGFDSVDLHFVGRLSDGNLYIGGTRGTILRQIGQTWQRVETSFTNTIIGIAFNSRGDLFALCDSGFLAVRRVSSNSWDEIFNFGLTGPTKALFKSLHFYNDSVGVLIGTTGNSPNIFHTRNGGANFIPVRLPSRYAGQLLTPSRLSVMADGRAVVQSGLTTATLGLLVSSDSGLTWDLRKLNKRNEIWYAFGFALLRDGSGVFAGRDGLLGRVDNIDADTNEFGSLQGVSLKVGPMTFAASNLLSNGEILATLGEEGYGILKSADGGFSWRRVNGAITYGMSISTARNNIFYGGIAGQLFKANLTGAEPERIPPFGTSPPGLVLGPIRFADEKSRGYFLNFDRQTNPRSVSVLLTRDGGDSWQPVWTMPLRNDTLVSSIRHMPQAFGSGFVVNRRVTPDTNNLQDVLVEFHYVDSAGNTIRYARVPGGFSHFIIVDDSTAIEYHGSDSTIHIVSDSGQSVQKSNANFGRVLVGGLSFVRLSPKLLAGVQSGLGLIRLSLSADNGKTWLFDTLMPFQRPEEADYFLSNIWFRERDTKLVVALNGFLGYIVEIKLNTYPIVRDNFVSSVEIPPGWAIGNQYLTIRTSPSPASSSINVTVHGLHSVRGEPIRLTVHDVNGAEVADWTQLAIAANNGNYAQFDASFPAAGSGVYFLRLKAGRFALAQKVVVVQ